jgi:molybdenum cofactor synthesis domain-containing protein
MAGQPSAAVLTIGNELVSGDVENTNGSWLATRLERLGVRVHLIASVPDDVERIASFVRANAPQADFVIVTGGLGGTPDDVTREAIAAAFDLPRAEQPDVAAELRARFRSDPEYAARWADLPTGARPLDNPLGGAPGFVIENLYVLPGLPAEMEAMFKTIEPELHGDSPIASWRRRYRTTESRIVGVLEAMGQLHPGVLVGSYPRFDSLGSEVEIVVKSRDPAALAAAAEWIEAALEEAMR